MIKAIVLKEWRQSLRQGHIRWVLVLALGLMITSSIHTYISYLEQQKTHALASAISREDWVSQEAKNPHSAAHYGLHVFKPWQLGSVFDPGILPYTGSTVFVEAHVKNDAMHPPMADRTSLARWGTLSPAFILLYLVPLILIILHFSSISGERASNMLNWTASTGVPFRTWLMGKYLSASAIPFCFIVVCFLGIWMAAGFAPAEIGRLAWLALGFAIFYAIILNGIFIVSALVRAPAACLIVLLGFWIFGSWMVPKLAATIAEDQFPAPAIAELRQRIDSAKKDGLMGDSTSDKRRRELEAQTLKEYNVERIEDLPINFDAVAMQAGEEYGYRVFDHFYKEVQDQYARQANLFRGFSFLSPVLPTGLFSMALAQTDAHAHWHFNHAVEMYRREFVEILNREMMLHSKTGEWGYHSHQSTWKKVPEFQYERPALGDNVTNTRGSLMVMAFWVVLSSLVLFGWIPSRRGWGT